MALTKEPWTLYYDGWCSLCIWIVKILEFFDIPGTVAYYSYRNLKIVPTGLSGDKLERNAYLVTSNGHSYQRFFAFRMITLRIPVLLILTPFLWLPGISIVGKAIYRRVSDNRYRLFTCGSRASRACAKPR